MVSDALKRLTFELTSGRIDRRSFVQRASALGISAGAATTLARSAEAQTATPSASPAASPVALTFSTVSVDRTEYLNALYEQFPIDEPSGTGGHLIYTAAEDLDSLNPINRSKVVATFITGNVFSTLVDVNVMDGTLVPGMADYWEAGSDGKTYRFYLNSNLRWHDGEPVTAMDVVYSFDAMLSEDNVAPYRSTVRGVTASYRALDNLTFEFTGIDATATLLDNSVAMVPIMPKHIWEPIPFSEWTAAPGSTGTDPSQVIGCGPFKFVEWVQGDHATITRNDDYFLPEHIPYLENYTIRIVADSKTAESSLVTGESDYGSVNPGDYQSFKDENPDFTYAEYDQWGWMTLELNADPATGTFFSDTRVRHALLHATDRDAIVENILFGFGTVAHGVQPPPSPAYAPDKVRTIYNYDPEQAKTLLEEAGWVDADGDGIREKDGQKFSVDFNYDASFTTTSQIVTYLQEAWKAVGIEANPVTNYVFDDVLAGKTHLAIGGIIWTAPDQGTLYRCDAIPPDGFNLSRHCNEEYDRINTESVYELDPDKRLELLIEQSNVINDDAPWPLLYFTKGATIVQPRVHNFYAAGLTAGLWSYNKIWIEEA